MGELIREAFVSQKCSFFNIVQIAFDPPTLCLNIYGARFSGKMFKKCENARHDKI